MSPIVKPHCLLHCQFGSADSTVLYTDCVLWLSVCITVWNIQIAVTVCVSFSWLSMLLACEYGICLLCYSLTLFNVTFVCKRFWETNVLLSVTDRSKLSADSTTNSNSTIYSVIKRKKWNWFYTISKQHISSVWQKILTFRIPAASACQRN